jgi:hypothetical protein
MPEGASRGHRQRFWQAERPPYNPGSLGQHCRASASLAGGCASPARTTFLAGGAPALQLFQFLAQDGEGRSPTIPRR